jgi:hypothetical protein
MNLNLKVLSLALLAVFALGAAAASAETLDHFTSETERTVLTGEQVGTEAENVFGVKAVASLGVHCKKATYGGTSANVAAIEVTLVPTYFECSSNFGSATITNDGCAIVIKGTTDKLINTEGKEEGKDATVDLECGESKSITISSGGCKINFSSVSGGKTVNQSLLGLKYTNEGSGTTRDVKVDMTVDKIHYTTEGFACELGGLPKTGTDGFLTERSTIKGYKDETVAPTLYQDEFKPDGNQVGIEVS